MFVYFCIYFIYRSVGGFMGCLIGRYMARGSLCFLFANKDAEKKRRKHRDIMDSLLAFLIADRVGTDSLDFQIGWGIRAIKRGAQPV
jgi:hypothetical protein